MGSHTAAARPPVFPDLADSARTHLGCLARRLLAPAGVRPRPQLAQTQVDRPVHQGPRRRAAGAPKPQGQRPSQSKPQVRQCKKVSPLRVCGEISPEVANGGGFPARTRCDKSRQGMVTALLVLHETRCRAAPLDLGRRRLRPTIAHHLLARRTGTSRIPDRGRHTPSFGPVLSSPSQTTLSTS